MDSLKHLIRARWILPIETPPIENGWLLTDQDGRVLDFGRGDPPGNSTDLGDVAVMPALVNAHTHLDLSDSEKPIGDSGMELADWIGQVGRYRFDSPQRDVPSIIASAMKDSLNFGVGLIGDIATPPDVVPFNPDQYPAVVSHAEVIGLSGDRFRERLASADQAMDQDAEAGISPHAPYSLDPAFIDLAMSIANSRGVAMQMHVAESASERELLFGLSRKSDDGGPFERTLRQMGVWRDNLFPWRQDDYCELIGRLAQARTACLVHGNDLNETETETLSRHPNLSVVYCPRTHAFFGHPEHPIDRFLERGIRVALGTDSLASNPGFELMG